MGTVTPYLPVTVPTADGDIRVLVASEAVASGYFDHNRRVLFVNGINNTGQNDLDAALTLSLLQMCTVVAIYNKTDGVVRDLIQCLGDKFQFSNGPVAKLQTALVGHAEADVRAALARNPCQVVMFDFLRKPENRRMEIFAHSQGNLLVSNVLMAIKIVDGAAAVKGWKVNTFGSPSVNWPDGLIIQEYGFTFDMVNILSGPNITRSISKVGWPSGTNWPVTHGFDWYMKEDPNFTINRFRTGRLGDDPQHGRHRTGGVPDRHGREHAPRRGDLRLPRKIQGDGIRQRRGSLCRSRPVVTPGYRPRPVR